MAIENIKVDIVYLALLTVKFTRLVSCADLILAD